MNLAGPERYDLTFDTEKDNRCVVRCSNGTPRFSGLAAKKVAKLYIISRENWPLYVGMTVQKMGTRLKLGFTAKGKGGYHGYAWRRSFRNATLDVWCPVSSIGLLTPRDAETIESEIVFLIRQSGQWPLFQTEIHFHESNADHRRVAAEIMRNYEPVPSRRDGIIP